MKRQVNDAMTQAHEHGERSARIRDVRKPILDLKTALMGEEKTYRPNRRAWLYGLLITLLVGAVLLWVLGGADR